MDTAVGAAGCLECYRPLQDLQGSLFELFLDARAEKSLLPAKVEAMMPLKLCTLKQWNNSVKEHLDAKHNQDESHQLFKCRDAAVA